MRSDMHKVIVERPRLLRGGWTNEKTAGRLTIDQCADATGAPEDYDSGASRASSARHGKWLNENLAPLRRYLMSQVGRPWDKVYGEIRRTIDTRSAIGLHVLQHLEGFVSIHTFVRDGTIYDLDRRGAGPVRGLYVHPVTGILLCTKNWRKRRDRKKKPKNELEFVWVSETAAYKKINGLWFRLEYRKYSDEGRPTLMFVSKRQCDRKTIRKIEGREFQRAIRARPCGLPGSAVF